MPGRTTGLDGRMTSKKARARDSCEVFANTKSARYSGVSMTVLGLVFGLGSECPSTLFTSGFLHPLSSLLWLYLSLSSTHPVLFCPSYLSRGLTIFSTDNPAEAPSCVGMTRHTALPPSIQHVRTYRQSYGSSSSDMQHSSTPIHWIHPVRCHSCLPPPIFLLITPNTSLR